MVLPEANNAEGTQRSQGEQLISPSIKLEDTSRNRLQFQQDQTRSSQSSRGIFSQRFFNTDRLDSDNEINYKIHVPNFASLTPLELGKRYIGDLIKIDSMSPPDIYSDENISKSGSKADSYYFSYENGLGEFSRFERINQLDLPETFFDEYNSTESNTKLGILPEIDRAWISVDYKLILWNYRAPQSSFNKHVQFLTIDHIKETILQVQLVKPKPNVFVKEINYMLLISTPTDIHLYIIKYDRKMNNLEIFNPNLSVSTQGLIVNKFAFNELNGDIYFSGEGEGTNIWRLDYSNKPSFIRNRCDKVCLTKSGISSVLPFNKLPGLDLFGSSAGSMDGINANSAKVPEVITQLEVDAEKEILYSLSNKSIIRVYKLQANQEHFTQFSQLSPSEILRSISNLFTEPENLKSFLKFRIVSIQPISRKESNNVQLIAITNYGCRIMLRLGTPFSLSNISSLVSSSNSTSKLKLSVIGIKFPPSRDLPQVTTDLDTFTRNKQFISQLITNQQKSDLLKNTKFGKVLSPGVFLCAKRTKKSDKLFICTANYGFLKKSKKLVEDAEFLKFGGQNDSSGTYIHDIVQLTPSMNATETPTGYANVSAAQYTKEPLKFAVLTNFGILFYQFRTSDQILKSLNDDTIENFIEENGYEETCSTLLYLSCSYGHQNISNLYKRNAQVLFSSCGNGVRIYKNPQSAMNFSAQYSIGSLSNFSTNPPQRPIEAYPSVEQVILSDRFYGTCLLISRLLRECWNIKIFRKVPHVKIVNNDQVLSSSIKEDSLLIQGLNISKAQLEYFIGSVIVLSDFFKEHGNSIQGLNAPNYSSDPTKFENEVCLRAEHIAFTSILKSLDSMKEALSFLMVLTEELEMNQVNFDEIIKFLSITNQVNLLSLSLRDLLLPNTEVRNLIKDLLSSIINKNILQGGSIDLIAMSLQGRCGSFCSTNDVLIFKAIENLTKAKGIGSRDNDLKSKCLKNASLLFEEASESLTLVNIENAINIMLDLEYYVGAVELLLKLASKLNSNVGPTVPIRLPNLLIDKDGSGDKNNERQEKKFKLYELIFSILSKIDQDAIKITETNDQFSINSFLEIRDQTYDTCFASTEKAFHYEFYLWFLNWGASERLLDIDTPYILPFLEEKAENDLYFNELLRYYYAKRKNYYAAATILYSLSISDFPLILNQRIEYLSRANGFCNCIYPPNLRPKMIELSTTIQELFEVANVQLDVLIAIKSDERINKENKEAAVRALNHKILSISELFNEYADPLGYYDLCLLIFKVSDYKNTDDILKRWELFFERIYHIFQISDLKNEKPLYVILRHAFDEVGPKLSSNDIVFPVDELIKLTCKYIQQAIEEESIAQKPPKGFLVDSFINSGVSCIKLYYIMRSLIENKTYDVYPDFSTEFQSDEMVYLIQKWYDSDKKLKELVSSNEVRNLTSYSSDKDPIYRVIKINGILY